MSSWMSVRQVVSYIRRDFAADMTGNIERMTTPRSHSKQGYHDARKTYWGDLYPHTPKGKTLVRDRGVMRLLANGTTPESDHTEIMDELFGRQDGETADDIKALRSIPGLTFSMGETSKKGYKPRQSLEDRKEERKKERMRVGKAYKIANPDKFDGFPMDFATEPEQRTPRGQSKGNRGREELARAPKASDVWNLDSLETLWSETPNGTASMEGEASRSVPRSPPRTKAEFRSKAGSRGRRSYGTWIRPQIGLGLHTSLLGG